MLLDVFGAGGHSGGVEVFPTPDKPSEKLDSGLSREVDRKISSLSSLSDSTKHLLGEEFTRTLGEIATYKSNLDTGKGLKIFVIGELQRLVGEATGMYDTLIMGIASRSIQTMDVKPSVEVSEPTTTNSSTGGLPPMMKPRPSTDTLPAVSTPTGAVEKAGVKVADRMEMYTEYLRFKVDDTSLRSSVLEYISFLLLITKSTDLFHKIYRGSQDYELKVSQLDTNILQFAETGNIHVFAGSEQLQASKDSIGSLLTEIRQKLEEQEGSIYRNVEQLGETSWLTIGEYSFTFINPVFDRYRERLADLKGQNNNNVIVSSGIELDEPSRPYLSSDQTYSKKTREMLGIVVDENFDTYKIKYGTDNRNSLIEHVAEELNVQSYENLLKAFQGLQKQLKDFPDSTEMRLPWKPEEVIYFESKEDRNRAILGLMYFYKGLAEDPYGFRQMVVHLGAQTTEAYIDFSTLIGAFFENKTEGWVTLLTAVSVLYLGTSAYVRGTALSGPLNRLRYRGIRVPLIGKEIYTSFQDGVGEYERLKGLNTLTDEQRKRLDSYTNDTEFMKMYERLQDINTRIKAAKIQGNIQKAELLESFKKWNITTKSDTRYEKKLFELLRVLDGLSQMRGKIPQGQLRLYYRHIETSIRNRNVIGFADLIEYITGKDSRFSFIRNRFRAHVVTTSYKEELAKSLKEDERIVSEQKPKEVFEKLPITEAQRTKLIKIAEDGYTQEMSRDTTLREAYESSLKGLAKQIKDLHIATGDERLGTKFQTAVTERLSHLLDHASNIDHLKGYIIELQDEVERLLNIKIDGSNTKIKTGKGEKGLVEWIKSIKDTELAQKVEDQLIAGLKAEGDVIVKNIDDTIADIVDLNTKLDTDIHKTEVRDKIKNGLLDSIGDDSTRISYIKRKTEVYISIRDRLTGNYSGVLDEAIKGEKMDWSVIDRAEKHFARIDNPANYTSIKHTEGGKDTGRFVSHASIDKIQEEIDFLKSLSLDTTALETAKAELEAKYLILGSVTTSSHPSTSPETKDTPSPSPTEVEAKKEAFRSMVRSSTALDRQHINGNMAYVRVTGKDGEQIHIRFDLTSNEADTIIDKLSNFKSSSRVATLRSIPGVAEYTPRSRTTSTESARASMLERLHAQYDEAEEFIRRAEMEIYLQTGNEVELQERAMIDDHLRAQTEIDLTNVRTLVSTHLRESYNIKRIREAQDLVREVARNIDRLSDDAITRVSQLLARGNYDTIRTEFNGKAFLKYLRKAVRRAKF